MKTLINKIKKKLLIKKRFSGSIISSSVLFNDKTKIEGLNVIYSCVDIRSSTLGIGTYIGENSSLKNCHIGKFCSVGSKVSCVSGTHPIEFISSYPGFYNNISHIPFGKSKANFNGYLKTQNGYNCEIGNDVWIGDNVLIKGGVHIGNGAVIGMGAVVTKDVPPYAIVAGVPAKVIRYRFPDSVIKELLIIRWWDWSIDKIQKAKDDFCDIELFIKKYKR